MAEYKFDNAWQEARQRLEFLEAALDPGSFRRLDGLEVRPGWHCLELGAGGGTVARWLADRVGVKGRVVATDLDTRFLDAINLDNVEVLRHDLAQDTLPAAEFDLVHARWVLLHIKERDRVLREIVSALRPGGHLLLEESYAYPGLDPETILGRSGAAFVHALEAAGASAMWAEDLPRRFQDVGLTNVTAEADVMFTTVARRLRSSGN